MKTCVSSNFFLFNFDKAFTAVIEKKNSRQKFISVFFYLQKCATENGQKRRSKVKHFEAHTVHQMHLANGYFGLIVIQKGMI